MVDLNKGATVELVKTLSDDLRTGADGTVYESAGAAIRAVHNRLENQIVSMIGLVGIDSWKDVQTIVRAGLASKIFSIGDQFTCQRNGVNLVWDVIGIDHDTPADSQYTHSLTLQLHDCFASDMPIDNREAFYYSENGLVAGTYNITVGTHAYFSSDNGKTYQFTLAAPVPAKGQLVFNQAYNVTLDGGTISSYASSTSITAIETVTMSAGNDGTPLGTINNTIQGNLNSMQRALLGSNNYKESAIRQWLNSNAAAGSVWAPQTNYDRPPLWASNMEGFLNGLDADFLAVVGNTHIVTARNRICEDGGSESTDDKFFLPSTREIYMEEQVNQIIEGNPYPYYSEGSVLPTIGIGADSNRIKYRGTTPMIWYLRTPSISNCAFSQYVKADGSRAGDAASNAHAIAPVCNII